MAATTGNGAAAVTFASHPPSRRGEVSASRCNPPGITGTKLDKLWSLSGNGNPALANDQPVACLDARLAYGFPLGNAPYTELVWEEAANAQGAGVRYGLNPCLELDLKGTRRSNADGNTEHRFSLDMDSDL